MEHNEMFVFDLSPKILILAAALHVIVCLVREIYPSKHSVQQGHARSSGLTWPSNLLNRVRKWFSWLFIKIITGLLIGLAALLIVKSYFWLTEIFVSELKIQISSNSKDISYTIFFIIISTSLNFRRIRKKVFAFLLFFIGLLIFHIILAMINFVNSLDQFLNTIGYMLSVPLIFKILNSAFLLAVCWYICRAVFRDSVVQLWKDFREQFWNVEKDACRSVLKSLLFPVAFGLFIFFDPFEQFINLYQKIPFCLHGTWSNYCELDVVKGHREFFQNLNYAVISVQATLAGIFYPIYFAILEIISRNWNTISQERLIAKPSMYWGAISSLFCCSFSVLVILFYYLTSPILGLILTYIISLWLYVNSVLIIIFVLRLNKAIITQNLSLILINSKYVRRSNFPHLFGVV